MISETDLTQRMAEAVITIVHTEDGVPLQECLEERRRREKYRRNPAPEVDLGDPELTEAYKRLREKWTGPGRRVR